MRVSLLVFVLLGPAPVFYFCGGRPVVAPPPRLLTPLKQPQPPLHPHNHVGGVKKEFFQLLMAELLSPDYGMLVYQPESRTFWFNACSLEGEEQFMLLGLVLGLAIYNRVLLDFPLPLALYKMLLGQPAGLRDLEDMQPTLGRSLRQLLQYDPQGAEGGASVEDTFCLTFSVDMDYFGDVRTVPLKQEGENAPVREDNRHEYVELMVDFLLRRSVERQFAAFARGFRILCDGPAIRLFNACELERLVCGELFCLGVGSLLFFHEMTTFYPNERIDALVKRNFGFMYKPFGKGAFMVFIAFLNFGLTVNTKLGTATGICVGIIGAGYIFLYLRNPEFFYGENSPSASLPPYVPQPGNV